MHRNKSKSRPMGALWSCATRKPQELATGHLAKCTKLSIPCRHPKRQAPLPWYRTWVDQPSQMVLRYAAWTLGATRRRLLASTVNARCTRYPSRHRRCGLKPSSLRLKCPVGATREGVRNRPVAIFCHEGPRLRLARGSISSSSPSAV